MCGVVYVVHGLRMNGGWSLCCTQATYVWWVEPVMGIVYVSVSAFSTSIHEYVYTMYLSTGACSPFPFMWCSRFDMPHFAIL